MENKTKSSIEYEKLKRLVNILNEKFEEKTGVDYFEAKDNLTRYDKALGDYEIDGIEKDDIISDDLKKIESVIKELEEKDQELMDSKKELEKPDGTKLEKYSDKEREAFDKYNELKDRDTSSLNDEEKKKYNISLNESKLKAAKIITEYEIPRKREKLEISRKIEEMEKLKEQLEKKYESKKAIEDYDEKEKKDIDKYYNILINHPEYKKSLIEIKDMQEKTLNKMQKEYDDSSYEKKYAEDKKATNFEDLSDDLKEKLEQEKDSLFLEQGDVKDENIFKQKIDEISRKEQEEKIANKKEQLDNSKEQIKRYTKDKTEGEFKKDLEEELNKRNATFSENDLVLKKYYDKIVKFEEDISNIEKETKKISSEIEDLEVEIDTNKNIKVNSMDKLLEKDELLNKLEADRKKILEEIVKVKEEMYKEQAFLDKVFEEKEELEKELKAKQDIEREEVKELLRDLKKLANEVREKREQGENQIEISDGYDKLFQYIGKPINIDVNNIGTEFSKIKEEALNNFEKNKKSKQIQEKIDNLNDFIGDRQKSEVDNKEEKEKTQEDIADSKFKKEDFDLDNVDKKEKEQKENENKNQEKENDKQSKKEDDSSKKPYTEQFRTNGPTRINPTNTRPKDITNDETEIAKESIFSKWKKNLSDKFNQIKNKVKNKFDNFKSEKNSDEKINENKNDNIKNNNQETVIIPNSNKIENEKEKAKEQENENIENDTVDKKGRIDISKILNFGGRNKKNKDSKENESNKNNSNSNNNHNINNNDKKMFEKAKEEYDQIKKEIEANVSTQKNIDTFISKSIDDIESGKYINKENNKENQEKEQENDQRDI